MKNPIYYLLICFLGVLFSCEKDKTPVYTGITYSEKGIFIVNEGAYGAANGSVSYMSLTQNGVIADIYKNVNGVVLGDVVQSMQKHNGRFYIVVNNSKKIEVARFSDFASRGTITGFMGPRYFLPVTDKKAYVTDWFSNEVKIVDLNNLLITGAIPVGNGPEQLAMSNNKVYVTNIGGWDSDSTVSVIDPVTNTVIKTIVVGLNPNSVIVQANGKLLILCGGTTGPDYIGGTTDDIGGRIVEIDPTTDLISRSNEFLQSEHPLKLIVNNSNNNIYFLSGSDGYTGKVAWFDVAAFNPTILINSNFYGLGVNPADGKIYCGRPGFSANSYMLRYLPNGTLIDSTLAGIGINSFLFN